MFPNTSHQADDALSKTIYADLQRHRGKFTLWQKKIVNVVCSLYAAGSGEPPLHAFKGGHVILHDAGDYYRFWVSKVNSWSYETANLGARRARMSLTLPSSHYNSVNVDQYEIRLPKGVGYGYGAILFGKTQGGNTWFQIEAHSGTWGYTVFAGVRLVLDVAQHGFDYLSHRRSGFQNVGPYGTSSHSDKHGTQPNLKTTPPVEVRDCGQVEAAHSGFGLAEYS